MSDQKTIVINGILYDLESGMPVKTREQSSTASHAVHVKTTTSATLQRKYVKAPGTTQTAPQTISKFAPHPTKATPRVSQDIAPIQHPVAAKVHAAQGAKAKPRTVKPSAVLKNEAIKDAMERAGTKSRKPVKTKKTRGKVARFSRIATAGAAFVLLGAYLTYLNMPAISTRVAAAQAGINATYPSYTPSGYSLTGPVEYDNGIVNMKFASNTGPQNYSVTEKRSTWDSTAVRENYVQPQSGNDFTITQVNGLTIYTFHQNAAWVNGGILYTISGDAPLSSEQVQRIAISM